MFSDKQKKWIKKGVLFLILLPIFLFLFVLPQEKYMIKDGGTMCYGPFLPVYEYRKVHGMTGCVDKDGNDVYLVGTEVYIFFIPVYENTHYEATKTGRRVEEDEMVSKVRTHNTAISDVLATMP
ncbi:MAG: hypothetical protein IKX04_01885 [Clostridiales bacterium]|nr:hypothetical protein [Clostridiales bacterium]MBR5057297.1 hypothetical protein [Clostridiales bacterium]